MNFIPVEKGQGMVEYSLIILLIALVAIIIMALIGPQVSNLFSRAYSSLPNK
jgi:pilus assembly protein Flp/PilA